MKALIVLAVVVLACLRPGFGALVLKGPADPVLEGEVVSLECVDTENEYNMSMVHFEMYSKYMEKWYKLEEEDELGYSFRRWCSYWYSTNVRREDGKLTLLISSMQTRYSGPYRCTPDVAMATLNSSEPLFIPVHYMREISVRREGVSSYNRYLTSLEDLRVSLGENVEVECSASSSETPEYTWMKEGGDWILPSNKLKLDQVRELDGGKYTCTARHPNVKSLLKSHTISITVLPEDAPWYESTNGKIILMTSAAGLMLLVTVLSMTAFLCRRAKRRKSKGPIDDRSQKKPIYTASVESLPSTTGDKQPLV
ncbi:carcinoembryonic antigen-related cell adhesion molecule 18 [Chanos chanos]|uniref:Carcinoembryonic antigen-related cell adhesion molecule 18 n=1 Tax=Chanos chanos TaxID=29144 RepID=A0A6J2W8Z2_CHACN|nr:carcinoembryonic antigen-related cell adhesion molecule 18-like [Chanos chanos]